MTEAVEAKAGMTISVRTRRDVVVVDPERFLAAARQAVRESNPEYTEAEVHAAIADVYDAVYALMDRGGNLAADAMPDETIGHGGRLPGERILDRPDGLSPAGWVQEVLVDESMPLQDCGCFLPENFFASRSRFEDLESD